MVSSSNKVESANLLTAISPRAKSSSQAAESFAKQLDTTVRAGRIDSKGAARTGGEVYGSGGRNNGVRQVSDAVSTSGGTTKPTPFAPATTSGNSGDSLSNIPTMLGMGPVPGTAPVQVPTSQPASTVQMTEGDAYWAQQPAAVQALRYMPAGDEKNALALSLANQGYSIDTQIMVLGWDPQMTMAARAGYGYAWVPSYGQSAITVQPGISDPYMSSNYDPASPPPGSIKVSTAFAVGTIQNPLVQVQS
jgi:hypothetical protein